MRKRKRAYFTEQARIRVTALRVIMHDVRVLDVSGFHVKKNPISLYLEKPLHADSNLEHVGIEILT